MTLKNPPIFDAVNPLFCIKSGAIVNLPPDLWKNCDMVISPIGSKPELMNKYNN